MQLLKYQSRGNTVKTLQKLLNTQGYQLSNDGDFGKNTEDVVKDFQQKNGLNVDGVVYTQTWTTLINKKPVKPNLTGKALKESDVTALAQKTGLEVAVIKAVKEVESSDSGFLKDGRPKILFEGHVFWRELKQRGYNPAAMQSGFEKVLYPKWTQKNYDGGSREWDRLEKAISISSKADVAEAAYASASYGLFQIMGFHYQSLGYTEIIPFLADMKESEGEQLKVFGKFMEANQLTDYLKIQWAEFARRYNGPGYKQNEYDIKLKNAYKKHIK